MLRAASSGVTSVIDGYGRDVAVGQKIKDIYGWNNVVLDANIPKRVQHTTYGSKVLSIPLLSIFLMLIFVLLFARR